MTYLSVSSRNICLWQTLSVSGVFEVGAEKNLISKRRPLKLNFVYTNTLTSTQYHLNSVLYKKKKKHPLKASAFIPRNVSLAFCTLDALDEIMQEKEKLTYSMQISKRDGCSNKKKIMNCKDNWGFSFYVPVQHLVHFFFELHNNDYVNYSNTI